MDANLVGIQALEKIDCLLEIVTNFLLRRVAGVAAGLDSVDASTVLSPLMLPEGLTIAINVDPILLHIGEKIGTVLSFQDIGDISVGAGIIAVGLVGAIAVIRPNM